MHWASKLVKPAAFGSVFVLGALAGVFGAPVWRLILIETYQEQYGELTFKCDSAMRSHYLAKARLTDSPTESDVEQLRQTELALIDCQDYDILQKRLIVMGLRENELGLMRLRAIEADAEGLRDVIESHEIRY